MLRKQFTNKLCSDRHFATILDKQSDHFFLVKSSNCFFKGMLGLDLIQFKFIYEIPKSQLCPSRLYSLCRPFILKPFGKDILGGKKCMYLKVFRIGCGLPVVLGLNMYGSQTSEGSNTFLCCCWLV